MTESVADKERRLAALTERLLPEMVEGLRRGDAALTIAQSLDERRLDDGNTDVDLKTLYRWVKFVEERLEKKRRRVGVLAAVLLWVGFLALGAGAVGMTTALTVPAPGTLATAGGALMVAGIAVWRIGKRRVGVTAEKIIG